MLQRRNLTEFLVAFLQQSFFGIVQPISLAVHHRMKGLRIELAVVDGHVRIDGSRHLHTDEASVARKIGQQVLVIACRDERSISTHLDDARTIRLAETCRRFL